MIMAKLEELTVQINVEGLLQKELIKVVEKMNEDHGVVIEDIKFSWVQVLDMGSKVTQCQVRSSYRT